MLNSQLLYAIKHLWLNRKDLRQYISNPNQHLHSITELQAAQLKEPNIQAVIFDFDGVLASQNESSLSPLLASWLRKFIESYTGQIFLLSNNLFNARLDYLRTNWPELKIIAPARAKPYPDGILEILRLSHLSKQQVLMIDDRLGTGILAAHLAGIPGLLIKPALTNYTKRPLIEILFASLRCLENFICLI